ncbi:MAG TPA: flagellar protein FlgN [Nitrospirota bacterium]|nr:flagellar protein FlgN [Nitrospirota bacterium]
MSSAETIKSILSEQVSGYRTLLDILQRERACLLQFNPSGIETLSKEKDTAVMKLKLLEEERVRLVGTFVRENGIAATDAFRCLSESTGDDVFQRLRLQLISLLQSIMELNSFNRLLIERSAAVVKNALNFLITCGVAVSGSKAGALLSREV